MKFIVTHQSPDIDALTAVWLIHRFRRGWKEAHVELVPQGYTLNDIKPDSDPNIIHVDTGLGEFDHHQTSDYTSAARLVFDDLTERGHIKETHIEAVERIVDVVTRYDHFKEAGLKDADDDIHAFSLAYIILGHRANQKYSQRLIELAEESLDGILQYMKGKVHGEEIIEKGHVFTSKWGQTLVLETDNNNSVRAAFMKGYDMVVRYSPNYKNVSMSIHPLSKKNLKKLHKAVSKDDPEAQWFLHSSGRMLMNASNKNTRHLVTKYTLPQILKIVKSI